MTSSFLMTDFFLFFRILCLGIFSLTESEISPIVITKLVLDNPLLTLLLSGLIGTIIISLFMPSVWVNPTSNQWILMALIGLIASVAHLFIILSLKLADASKLAPLGYTEIITNILISHLFYGPSQMFLAWVRAESPTHGYKKRRGRQYYIYP